MAAQDYASVVQQLYVSYFGRPADYYGLQNFESALAEINAPTTFAGVQAAVQADAAGTTALSKLVNSFNASAESAALYGTDNSQVGVAKFVNAIYQNVLGREADISGFNYWVNAISTGQLTKANAAAAITAAASTNTSAQGLLDAKTVANKLAVATTFTAALDTPSKITAYSGDAAALNAHNLLAGVNSGTDLVAYQANITQAVNTVAGGTGQTFTLTAGLDNFAGTGNNDIFNVYSFNPTTGVANAASTLSAFDTIDGGAGTDTLNLDLTGNAVAGTIKNVEVINITGNMGSVDASKFVGATNVNIIGNTGDVTGLAANATAGFNGTVGNLSVGAAGASASVNLSSVPEAATLTVTGDKLSVVNVSGSRIDAGSDGVAAQTLTINAGKDVQKITLTTNQDTTLTLVENGSSTKHITSLDASASTGKIAATGDANLINIMTGSGNDTVVLAAVTAAAAGSTAAVNAAVSTGAGNDDITVNATGDGKATIDAGAGNDTITVTKVDGLALNIVAGDGNDTVAIIAGTVQTSDVINGGAGSDTISLSISSAHTATTDDYITFNKLLSGFETIQVTGDTETLDASQLSSTYTSIDLFSGSTVNKVGTQAVVANGDLIVTSSGYDNSGASTVYAGTVNLTEKATGTVDVSADVLKLAVNAVAGSSGSAVAATLAGDVQTANVTLTNATNGADTPTDFIASLVVDTGTSDAALKSLTLSGNGSANVTNAAGAKLVTVDASALGGTLAADGSATTGLTYSSVNTSAETIKLGSGIDNITIGASHYGSVDTVQGLHLVLNTAGDALGSASDVLTITGVTAAIKFTTTQTDLDLALKDAAASTHDSLVFQMGGNTYVFQDSGTVANQIDSGDIVVKLVGNVDIDSVIVSLAHSTIV
jgi:hypothetical protein